MKAIRLAHSELTGTIYAIIGREKIDITEQAIAEVKAIKALEEEPKTDVLDKISDEIKRVEINGYIRDAECFVAGLNTAVNIIGKYRKEN